MLSNSKSRVISSILSVVFILAILSLAGVSLMTGDVHAITSAFSQIEAESYSSLSTSTIQKINIGSSGYGLGYINNGNYVVYDYIDFGSTGTISFKAKVATQNATTIEIRSGSSTGTLLGTLSVSSTGNYDSYQEMSCSVNNITGIQNIYLVFGNAVNIDWFSFTQAATPTPSSFYAFSQLEAESYSSLSTSTIQKVSISPSGYGLGYIHTGDYVAYNNVNFGSTGTVSFKAKVATQNTTTIQIRLGSSTGTLLGTLSVSSTGSYDSYQEMTCSVNSITGTQNLYLVFGNAVNIDWFIFTQAATATPTPVYTIAPTPVPTPVYTIAPTPVPTPISTTTSSGALKVEFYNSNISSSTQALFPYFKITNTSSSSLSLSTVKLRYYYTTDGTSTQIPYCDYSSVGSANVNLACSSLGTTFANADYYLEIGFSTEAGTLASGGSAYIQTRITNINWLYYTQTNDYSFNSSASVYTNWNYVTGYINSALVWGIQPGSSIPTPAISSTPTPTVALAPPTVTPTITPTITPTPTIATATSTTQTVSFSQIEAENYNSLGGTSIQKVTIPTGGYGLGYISTDDYAVYNNVDFGNGASSFKAKLATSVSSNIEIRIGSIDGALLGNLYVSSTGSWDTYQEISCGINSGITGVNTLYLKFKGPLNIDYFALDGAVSTPTPTPTPIATTTPTPSIRSAFIQIQAENYDSAIAPSIQTFGISDSGTAIGYLSSGNSIAFNNVDFESGTTSYKARIAAQDATSMEIRSGSASGTLLSTIAIPSTGSWDTYQEISCSVSNITGIINLYFVFNGPVNFDWFVFSPTTTVTSINAFSRIEAENNNGVSDTNIQTIGNVIGYIQSGNYIVFNNVNFGTGAKSIKAYVANASGSTTDIQIRIGSSTGTLFGTLSVASTSSWDVYQELACNISTITGNNNLYLVFTGPVNFDWFTFSMSGITVTPSPTFTPSPTPTSTIALAPPTITPEPTIEIVIPTNAISIDQPNLRLSRTAPPKAELASVKSIYSTQDGELTLNGMGTLQGEKEIVLLVDNSMSNETVSTDIVTPFDFGIFSNKNIRGVGDRADIYGNVHANEKFESYIADLNVSGTCSASTLSIGYGSTIDGGTNIITSPLPMPVFHEEIIAEIDSNSNKDDLKFYPTEFPDSSDREFPNQPGFHIRYEHSNNTFVITGAGTFNLEHSMYFDGNVRISVPHIVNTNSNFLVAEGFVNLEGHDINTAELDENTIDNNTNLLNIYSIHGRIFVATSSSKIYGTLYAAGENDPTGEYTNDVGVVLLQGINTSIYGSIVAGGDIRIEGSTSKFYCTSVSNSRIENKYLRSASVISSKEAAKNIVDQLTGTNTKMFAIQYSDLAYVDTSTFDFFNLSSTLDQSVDLKNYIDSFPENLSGFSNLGDALRRGMELLNHPTKSSANATKYIIVLAANAPNKWTSSVDPITGNATAISGDGLYDADGSSMTYALNVANLIKTSGIRPIFINNSNKDISANIENIAVTAGAALVSDGKHYYDTTSMIDFFTVYKYVMTVPPKKAYIKKATYIETFPEGIEIVEKPTGAIIEPVGGTTRQRLIIDDLDIELTHDGTKYIINPFSIEVKVRAKKIGDIPFLGSDSTIFYDLEYIDLDGNVQNAYSVQHFDGFILNVYMTLDIG